MTKPEETEPAPLLRVNGNRVSGSTEFGIKVSVPLGLPAEVSDNWATPSAGTGISVEVRETTHLIEQVSAAQLTKDEQKLLVSTLEQTVGTAGHAAETVRPRSKRVADVLTTVSSTVISSTLVAMLKQAFNIP